MRVTSTMLPDHFVGHVRNLRSQSWMHWWRTILTLTRHSLIFLPGWIWNDWAHFWRHPGKFWDVSHAAQWHVRAPLAVICRVVWKICFRWDFNTPVDYSCKPIIYDVFQPITFDEISSESNLIEMFVRNHSWGSKAWCCHDSLCGLTDRYYVCGHITTLVRI